MNLQCSSEAQLLFSAASHGPRWVSVEQVQRLVYEVPDLTGQIFIETATGESFGQLAARLQRIHPDAAAVIAWVLSELIGDPREAPSEGTTPAREFALSRIVTDALGVDVWKLAPSKRTEMLGRVDDALWLASRARVEAERPGIYDLGGGQRGAVKVAVAPFLIQPLNIEDTRPIREIALSRSWRSACTGRRAQFVPVGNVFGVLSSGRPSGALARSLLFYLTAQARIHREDALAGKLKPLRPGEALQRFGAALPNERHAERFIEAWAGALAALVQAGIVAPTPDTDPAQVRRRLGVVERGKNAAARLLSIPVSLQIGPALRTGISAPYPLKVEQRPPKSGAATPSKWSSGRGGARQIAKSKPSGVGSGSAEPSAAKGKETPNAGLFGEGLS